MSKENQFSELPGAAFSKRELDGDLNSDKGGTIKLKPPVGFAVGDLDITSSNNDFAMQIRNFVTNKEWKSTAYGDDRIHFHFHLQGKNIGSSEDQQIDELPFTDLRFAVFLEPKGLTKHMTWQTGDIESSVIIDCNPEFLINDIGVPIESLPHEIFEFIKGERKEFCWIDIPLPTSMMLIARDIINPKIAEPIRKSYRVAKGMELLCLGADALCTIGWENVQRSDLQFRDHFRINQARQILEEKFRDPPNIQDLARIINIDASTLCKQFKTIYKCSIFEFTQKYRMEHASELLKSSDLGIKQIAYELNYSHTSNFTAAFKKYFGITPRAYRESHLMSSTS